MPYLRGTVERTTGVNIIPAEVEHRRDLDTLADKVQNTWSLCSLSPFAGFRFRSRPFPDGIRQLTPLQPYTSDYQEMLLGSCRSSCCAPFPGP
jgi:hypothetical protein